MYDDLAAPGEANVSVGPGGERLAEMNRGITPLFFVQPIKNPSKTQDAGRPIFDNTECVTLLVAGDQYNQITIPVDGKIKERFPDQYQKWRDRKEAMTISGTPIKQWPLIGPAQIAEFEAIKIFSVEALANIPDSSLQKVQGLREWKAKAAAWLESSKDGAAIARYAEENVALKDSVSAMQRQIEELTQQVAALVAKPGHNRR
jgi:hypothetical protein